MHGNENLKLMCIWSPEVHILSAGKEQVSIDYSNNKTALSI
jgi:hypothetical protein